MKMENKTVVIGSEIEETPVALMRGQMFVGRLPDWEDNYIIVVTPEKEVLSYYEGAAYSHGNVESVIVEPNAEVTITVSGHVKKEVITCVAESKIK